MKKEVLIVLFLSIIMTFLPIVNASVKVGNISGSIETSYSPSENIRGWINISVLNEFYDMLVKGTNLNGEIKLIDLLGLNSLVANTDYICNTKDCAPYYKVTGTGETSKTFSLSNGQNKVLAFKLQGNTINSISSLTLDINVDNNELTCTNPLEIDILVDNIEGNPSIEWKSTKFSQTAICPSTGKYGCFDESASSEEVSLTYPNENVYCEKIQLNPSKYYNLGAYVINTTAYKNNIRMSLYGLPEDEIPKCTLASISPTGESFCRVNASSIDYETKDYYVCIQKTNSDGSYKIKRETTGEKCGFYGDPSSAPTTFSYDYYIFAESYKFDKIGKIIFNETEYENQGYDDLGNYLETYLEKYDSTCTNGCALPIKFKANTAMKITISNILLNYDEEGGALSTTEIYEVETTKPKISFNYTSLNLEGTNLTVPSSYGNYSITLSVGSTEVTKTRINVLKVPIIKAVYPTITPAATPTTFVVQVETQDNKSIVNYTWYFGDGSSKETKTNSVVHAYNETGGYALKVQVIDSTGLSSEKTFSIFVGSPEEAINETLIKYTKRIQNLTLQIASFPLSYQIFVKKVINTDNLTSQLQELQRQYNTAGGDEGKYVDIMNQLVTLNVPYKINITSKGDLPYYTNYENINLDSLKDAGAGDYERENSEEYKLAIGGWEQENLAMTLHYEYVSAYYDNDINQLMGIFKLKITPDEEIKGDEENYLIFGDAVRGNNFDVSDSSYNIKQLDKDVAIKFSDINEREILFYYTGEKIYNNLNMYMSPRFFVLDIITDVGPCDYNGLCEGKETWKNCRADCKPWKIAWVLWVFLIFITFIVYLIISQWYRINYESHLFKNRQDINNLLNFVNMAVHQGLTYNTIRQKLKEMGWNNEQITYLLNKYQGKSIVPLDISKMFSKKAKADYIETPTQN